MKELEKEKVVSTYFDLTTFWIFSLFISKYSVCIHVMTAREGEIVVVNVSVY